MRIKSEYVDFFVEMFRYGSIALLSVVFTTSTAMAEKGHGHYSVGFQVIHIDGFKSTIGTLPIGTADTQSLYFDIEYGLTDKLTVSLGLPLIRKRYNGQAGHNPATLIPPRAVEFIDDGKYRTEFQDVHIGLQYHSRLGDLVFEPFVLLGVPSNDYPFFAHAAVGQNLWKIDVGASFAYQLPLSDFYFRLAPSYVFVEETLGVSINHWRLDADVGYFFTESLSGKIFAVVKEGDGLDFPDEFPPPRTDERWYQHDRLVRHNYINVGFGANWAVSQKNDLSFSAMTMTHADQVHVMKYAYGLTWSRSF